MVDADRKLIQIEPARRGRVDVVGIAGARRGRKQRQQARALLAPKLLWNLVSIKRPAVVEGILEGLDGAEVASLESVQRDGSEFGLLLAAVLILPAYEEESLFAPDGAAQHQAVLIAMEGRFERCEEAASVERCVAMEFPGGAVKLVGSRARGHNHLSARLPPVLRPVRSRENAKFAHRVENRPMQRLVSGFVIVVHAVEHVLIRDLGVAGDIEASPESEVGSRRRCEDVRLELRELEIIAAIKRQLHHLLLVHHVADRGVLGRQQWPNRADLYLLRDGTDLERQVKAGLFAGLEQAALAGFLPEAIMVGGETGLARGQLVTY